VLQLSASVCSFTPVAPRVHESCATHPRAHVHTYTYRPMSSRTLERHCTSGAGVELGLARCPPWSAWASPSGRCASTSKPVI